MNVETVITENEANGLEKLNGEPTPVQRLVRRGGVSRTSHGRDHGFQSGTLNGERNAEDRVPSVTCLRIKQLREEVQQRGKISGSCRTTVSISNQP